MLGPGVCECAAARCVRVTSFWRWILDGGKLWTKLTSSEGGRQSKTSFLLILNIDFKMLYCSLWRPGCSASAGNMICYNEWNKLKQECLPSLFKLNLYLAQSVSGGLIQRVTNIITTLNLNIRLFYFWKIWLGCRWWGVGCTVSGAGCGLAWSDLNVAARARWSHHHAASRHPDIILWQRWPPPASVFYPHIIARVAALPSSWRISNLQF